MIKKIINLAENIFFYILIFFKNIFFIHSSNSTTISVPTIRSDEAGFTQSFRLANLVIQDPINIFVFNFNVCSKLSHNGIVLLGGLINFIQNQDVSKRDIFEKNISWVNVEINIQTMSPLLIKNLIDYNFFYYFRKEIQTFSPQNTQTRYIGYREHTSILDVNALTEYLENDWLSNDKLKLSHKLKVQIISKIMEIFMNAYGHGVIQQKHKKLGVYSCGEYDKREKKLHLSVLDFGIGIVKNVMKHSTITDSIEAMRWALTFGNSTNTDSKDQEIARGLGLDLLREFVAVNEGELRIYSNDVKAYANKEGSFTILNNESPFPGTLVSITINCDDKYYAFASEDKPHSYF